MGGVARALRGRAGEVEELRAALAGEPWPALDELGLLRYVMSFPTVAAAAEAAREGQAFRAKHLDALQSISQGRPFPRAGEPGMEKLAAGCNFLEGRAQEGQLVLHVRSSAIESRRLGVDVDPESVGLYIMANRESAHLICDADTRRTGELKKLVVVNDLTGMGVWDMPGGAFASVAAEVARLTELAYPQLMDRVIFANGGFVFRAVFAVLRPMISQASAQQVRFCAGSAELEKEGLQAPALVLPEHLQDKKKERGSGGSSRDAAAPERSLPNAAAPAS